MQFMSHLDNSYPPSCSLCVNSKTHKLAYKKKKNNSNLETVYQVSWTCILFFKLSHRVKQGLNNHVFETKKESFILIKPWMILFFSFA